MEIEIIKENPTQFTVTINNNETVIKTTVAENRIVSEKDAVVNEWVKEISKLCGGGKKKKKNSSSQTLAIGLVAEHSVHYRNSNYIYKSNAKDTPYEILRICVGDSCLIYDSYHNQTICKALRELLTDNKTIVFGVGMEAMAKKIDKDFGLKFSKAMDLRKLADCSENVRQGYFGKYNLEKLAVAMLGKEREVVKPASINWFEGIRNHWNWHNRALSEDNIKYGAVDAFLAYEMGMKFLENGTIDAFPEYENLQKNLKKL